MDEQRLTLFTFARPGCKCLIIHHEIYLRGTAFDHDIRQMMDDRLLRGLDDPIPLASLHNYVEIFAQSQTGRLISFHEPL